MLRGVDCQLVHKTVAAWEAEMDTVLVNHEAGSLVQKALEGLENSITIHGPELVDVWKARVADYPLELAVKTIRYFLAVRPMWYVADRMSSRDAVILAGLKRIYYSTFQFKRM